MYLFDFVFENDINTCINLKNHKSLTSALTTSQFWMVQWKGSSFSLNFFAKVQRMMLQWLTIAMFLYVFPYSFNSYFNFQVLRRRFFALQNLEVPFKNQNIYFSFELKSSSLMFPIISQYFSLFSSSLSMNQNYPAFSTFSKFMQGYYCFFASVSLPKSHIDLSDSAKSGSAMTGHSTFPKINSQVFKVLASGETSTRSGLNPFNSFLAPQHYSYPFSVILQSMY